MKKLQQSFRYFSFCKRKNLQKKYRSMFDGWLERLIGNCSELPCQSVPPVFVSTSSFLQHLSEVSVGSTEALILLLKYLTPSAVFLKKILKQKCHQSFFPLLEVGPVVETCLIVSGFLPNQKNILSSKSYHCVTLLSFFL